VTGWFGDGLVAEDGKALSFTINTISRASIIIRPPPLGKDKLLLMRIDLRNYFPREGDLKDALKFWDDLEFDPAFSLIITRGTLAAALVQYPNLEGKAAAIKAGKRAAAKPKVDQLPKEPEQLVQPRPLDPKEIKEAKPAKKTRSDVALKDVKLDDIDLIKFAAPHLHQMAVAELQEVTGTPAPLVTDGYLTFRGLNTIKDKGIFEVIYGGRYYEFAGVPQNSKVGTDEDNLFEQLGIGNVAGGVNAAAVFDKIRSDQRTAIFRSDVTGSPRMVEVLPTLVGRDGSAFISISHDLKTDDIDNDVHPIFNLIEFKDFARELIWRRPNGLQGYAAVAAATGNLADEVPFNVAIDRTISAPHVARLQAAISCIACHQAKGGSDGWIKMGNDVKALVNPKTGRLDIFGDITKAELNKPIADTLDRLAGLYAGDLERAFQLGRDDYAASVLRATGPMAKANAGQTDVVKVATTRVVDVSRGYYFDLVDARQALKECGLDVAKEEAAPLLRTLLGPDLRAAVDVPFVQVIVPEDVRIAALQAGLSIVRTDWDLSRSFVQERLQQGIARLQQQGAK
jgi:hypothetical protein